ncbi:helix-turn-helix transcriptional regulator [Vibrio rotiferianus]
MEAIKGNDVICLPGQNLTKPERRVLLGLADGETPTELKIALDADNMSLRHLELNLMAKLGAKTKTHVVSRGFVLGVLVSRALCLVLAFSMATDFDNNWSRIRVRSRTRTEYSRTARNEEV